MPLSERVLWLSGCGHTMGLGGSISQLSSNSNDIAMAWPTMEMKPFFSVWLLSGNPQSLRHLVQTTAAETPTRATSQELPIAAETPGAATAPTAGNGTTAGSTAPRATSSGGPNTTAANTTAASESATSSSEAQIAAGNDTLLAPLNETGTLTSANRTSAGGAAGGGAGVDGNGTFQGTAALPGANRSSASQASSSYAVPLADCPAGQTAIASECVSNSQAPGATSNGVIGAVQQQGSAAAGLKPANDAGVQQWVVALLLMVFMAAVAPV